MPCWPDLAVEVHDYRDVPPGHAEDDLAVERVPLGPVGHVSTDESLAPQELAKRERGDYLTPRSALRPNRATQYPANNSEPPIPSATSRTDQGGVNGPTTFCAGSRGS